MDDTATTSRAKGGRIPRYDWGDKRDICYKLYVTDGLTPEAITKHFAQHFNVDQSELPCRRSFIRQFRIWGFPAHRNKLDPNEEALATTRIKELWEQNVSQKDIKATLADEGFELRDYDFAKLWRKKLGLRLRNDNGFREPSGKGKPRKRPADAVDGNTDPAMLDGLMDAVAGADQSLGSISAPLGPEAAALRARRLDEIQAESDQRMHDKKRRRRIRGYAHLPPDAPGTQPRFNSETSLDECKAMLHLSNDMYQTVRNDYEKICRDLGIIKKTMCADGVWEESKQRLVRENLHLTAMTHPLQPDQEKKAVCLDVIASDVTKRMRNAEKALTIAEANNLLGLNPTHSKAVRRTMYEILAADNFESTLISGNDHYLALKQHWIDSDPKLQQAAAQNNERLTKAVDLLCSDARKRFREDKNKRGERIVVQRNSSYGPGPGPAWAPRWKNKKTAEKGIADASNNLNIEIKEPHVRAAVVGRGYPAQDSGNLITNLANTTGNINFDLDPALSNTAMFDPPMPSRPPIPAYFRLDASNSRIVGHHPKMWLGKLASPNIASLHAAATSKAGATSLTKSHGLVKNTDGTEDSWLIENDDELEVYLGEAGEKATFLVALEGRYS